MVRQVLRGLHLAPPPSSPEAPAPDTETLWCLSSPQAHQARWQGLCTGCGHCRNPLLPTVHSTLQVGDQMSPSGICFHPKMEWQRLGLPCRLRPETQQTNANRQNACRCHFQGLSVRQQREVVLEGQELGGPFHDPSSQPGEFWMLVQGGALGDPGESPSYRNGAERPGETGGERVQDRVLRGEGCAARKFQTSRESPLEREAKHRLTLLYDKTTLGQGKSL